MPKTGHKKFLKSEKAKVKLKGSKLQKGLNVTKTDFKIKKIVIREQLKEANAEEALSSRKLNVKECITRLNHNNASFRTEALRNLKDIINHFGDEVVAKHLNATVQAVSALALDFDKDVRRESFKTMSMLLSIATEDQVRPFFDLISSYLRCAMTHIQPFIQEDSLLMLDVLLLYIPTLVASRGDKILVAFLEMISKLRVESQPGRTLSVHMGGSTLTSVKWRAKVLDRLLGMLKAIVTEIGGEGVVKKSTSSVSLHTFDATAPMYFALPFPAIHPNPMSRVLNKANAVEDACDKGTQAKKYVDALVPLLFETWMEVRPELEDSNRQEETHISNEAAFTLKIVLEIIEKLWQLLSATSTEMGNDSLLEWFRNNYAATFQTHLLQGFPFVQNDIRSIKGDKRNAKGKTLMGNSVEAAGGRACYQQNFNVIFLYSCFGCHKISGNKNLNEKLLGYARKFVRNLTSQSIETCSAGFLKVLRSVLVENGSSWLAESNDDTKKLLLNVLTAYEKAKGHELRLNLLLVVCDIILNDNLCISYGRELFNSWMTSLPDTLLEAKISSHTLQALACLGKQQNQLFLKCLEPKLMGILENLSRIKMEDDSEQKESGQRSIVNLFFWIRDMSDQKRKHLLEQSKTHLDGDLKQYFEEILSI